MDLTETEIRDKSLGWYFRNGWECTKTTEVYYEVRKPKRVYWGNLALWTIFFNIFGFIGYLIYYATKPPWETRIVKKPIVQGEKKIGG